MRGKFENLRKKISPAGAGIMALLVHLNLQDQKKFAGWRRHCTFECHEYFIEWQPQKQAIFEYVKLLNRHSPSR